MEAGKVDSDGPVFTHCNVCGILLRTEEEDKLGMCNRCAWGIEQDAIQEGFELYQEDHREIEE